MRNIKCYKFRLFLIRFVIIGLLSYIVEVYFTAIVNLVQSIYNYLTISNYVFDLNKATEGHTGIFAFFVYCWAAIPFTFLTNPLKKIIKDDLFFYHFGVLLRGMIFGLIFMGIEFIIGFPLLVFFNARPWDYSDLPLNIDGVVTFTLYPLWTLAGIIGEAIHERLLQIDDILLNPAGYSDTHITIGFSKYKIYMEKRNSNRQCKKENLRPFFNSMPYWQKIASLLFHKKQD